MARYINLPEDAASSADSYSNPWIDFSSKLLPKKLTGAFKLANMIWNRLDSYRAGLQKVVRYFLTEIDYSGTTDEKKEWRDLLSKTLGVESILPLIGDEYLVYGNSLPGVYLPFMRQLLCPGCHTKYSIKRIPYKYTKGKFYARCLKCNHEGAMKVFDQKSADPSKIHIIRWNPMEISLNYHPLSGAREYRWKVTSKLKDEIRKGNKFFIETTPMSVLKCIKDDVDLILDQRTLKHLRVENLAGVDSCGWGIPPILASWGQLYYVQLLRRYNEAIALDYLIPMRILTPTQAAPSDSGTDPVLAGMGSAVFLDKILDMVQKKRKDPTAWFTLPFPVQFTSINEGVQMLRPDLIVQGLEDLLNGMGVPIEFYRGSLRWRGDPAAIRLMEKTWIHLTMSINSLLDWLTDVLSSFLNKERVDARLLPPSMYDDIARKQLLLQLAFNQKISDETAFAPWNINISQENELMAAEQKAREEAFAPPEEAQSLGAPVGSPQAAQMQQPQTLTDLEAVSKQIAQQLIAAPESLRTSQLISLKKTNKSLHAMVRMELDAIRQQSNLEGGVMLRQSQGMPG